MILRFVLVGAVTCLGLDLPIRSETSREVASRCVWCAGRATEATIAIEAPVTPDKPPAPMPEGEDAFVVEGAVEESPSPRNEEARVAEVVEGPDLDAAFGEVMAATILAFDQELLALRPDEETPLASAETTLEPAVSEPEPDLYPGLAFALNREAEKSGIVELPEPLLPEPHPYWELERESFAQEELTIPVEVAPAREEALAGTPLQVESRRTERLQTAVRLTGQALHAWLSLLQAPALAYGSDLSVRNR